MKKQLFLLIMLLLSSYVESKNLVSDNYRRNSLCLGYIIDGVGSQQELDSIIKAVQSYQISDKFNNHSIGWIHVNLDQVKLTEQDKVKIKRHTERMKFSDMRRLVSISSAADYKAESAEDTERFVTTPQKLIKVAKEWRLANYMVGKWFNPTANMVDGSYFNMDLIQERGAYNASELEKLRANEAVRGMAILKDAGMDLIPNTYLAFVRLKYTSAEDHYEETAKRWDNVGISMSNGQGESVNPLGIISALKRGSGQQQAGYYVDATVYLFKLNWDEEKENEFITKYWNTPTVDAFIAESNYTLEYIDCQTSQSRIKAKTGINSKEENSLRLIAAATYRAIDDGLAQLQKKFPNFSVMSPVIDVEKDAISAFVGLKEGISKGDKYDVYEKVYNENDNTFRYKKVSSIEVDKSKIWDNRYDIYGNFAGRQDGPTEVVLTKDKGETITIETGSNKTKANPNVDRTYFKGNTNGIAPGMLIKQKGK